jgi:hypothetical protein
MNASSCFLALLPTLNHLSLSAARGSVLLGLLTLPPIAGENSENLDVIMFEKVPSAIILFHPAWPFELTTIHFSIMFAIFMLLLLSLLFVHHFIPDNACLFHLCILPWLLIIIS